MKAILLPLLLVVSSSSPAQTASSRHSPPLAEAPAASVGMSAARLDRIDEMCRKAVGDGDVPGIVALVARRGKIVYHKAFGMADPAAGRALRRDDIFRIASQTKAITATAVMMLWEQGKFRLDDPISKYLPEFKNPQLLKTYESETNYTTEPAKSEITIRELLDHTSGLGYGAIDNDEHFRAMYKKAGIIDAFTTEPVSLAENERKLAKLPLHHKPGERFTYSEGLDVLGYLIEVVTGQSFDQFLRQHLFDPLGMGDTWFYLPERDAARLVPVETKKQGQWVRQPTTFTIPIIPLRAPGHFSPAAAVFAARLRIMPLSCKCT